jgi:tetratricopeptide (TPR) repeat protein
VLDDLVGGGDLGQVGAGGARLLARPAPFGPLIGPLLSPRGLAQAVRGRRLGGVGGVLAEPALQLGHPRLQRGDQAGLLGVDRAQLHDDRSLDRDGGFQIRIRGRDRGLHDNEPASPLARGPDRTATPQASDSQLAHSRRDGALNSYQRRTGRFREADAVHTKALRIYRDLGDRYGEANVLNELGVTRRAMGDLQEANAAHTQALEIFRDLGDRHGEANVLNELGATRLVAKDLQKVTAAYNQAMEIFRDYGNRNGEAQVLNNIGKLLLLSRQPHQALDRHQLALRLAREIHNRLFVVKRGAGTAR